MTNDVIDFVCPTCMVCGEQATVKVRKVDLERWKGGDFIQVAFPEMPPAIREMMMTGTHGECWDKLMGDMA